MTNLRALNQSEGSGPFWDFVASMDNRNPGQARGGPPPPPHGPSSMPPMPPVPPMPAMPAMPEGFGWGGRHGRRDRGERHRRNDGDNEEEYDNDHDMEHDDEPTKRDDKAKESHGEKSDDEQTLRAEGKEQDDENRGQGRCRRGSRGAHGFGGRGGGGGRGGYRGSRGGGGDHHHHHHQYGPHARRWGPGMWGGPYHHGHGPEFGPRGMPFGLDGLASWVQNAMDPQGSRGMNNNNDAGAAQDFKPVVDIFDTPNTFVVHASLPGAKKSDIAVSWDAEKSTLLLTGVVHRPGDEEFLKTLELGERQVGAFERKVVLGTVQDPAYVDEDGIRAKLEDGILRVEVPKITREEGYVDVKKVDIE